MEIAVCLQSLSHSIDFKCIGFLSLEENADNINLLSCSFSINFAGAIPCIRSIFGCLLPRPPSNRAESIRFSIDFNSLGEFDYWALAFDMITPGQIWSTQWTFTLNVSVECKVTEIGINFKHIATNKHMKYGTVVLLFVSMWLYNLWTPLAMAKQM